MSWFQNLILPAPVQDVVNQGYALFDNLKSEAKDVSWDIKNPDTIDKVAKWVLPVFVGLSFSYLLLKETIALGVGAGLLAYQKKFPGQAEKLLDQLAQKHAAYRDKKFGVGSIVLSNKLVLLATLALASHFKPSIAKFGAVAAFGYITLDSFLSPKDASPAPEQK